MLYEDNVAKLEKLDELKSEIRKHDKEIDEIQDKIDDLEADMEYYEDLRSPISKEIIQIEWDLGIRVSKKQLKLFDVDKSEHAEEKLSNL